MNIAIIPARGGSKRIPKKNIRNFLGKPIIAYSIEAAKLSNCFEKIIVSTDDDAIAEIAVRYGAEVPFVRDPSLADDYTGTNEVVADALDRLDKDIFKYACCIYATAPFVTSASLLAGLQLLSESPESDFSVTVTSFDFPIQRAVCLDKSDNLVMREAEHRLTRSQDLQEMYHDAGQIYWGKVSAFTNKLPLFDGNTKPIVLPKYMVQDIDTEEDWRRAEIIFKVLREQDYL